MTWELPDAEDLLQRISSRNHITAICSELRDSVISSTPPLDALHQLLEHAGGCSGCQHFMSTYLGFREGPPTDACLFFRAPLLEQAKTAQSDLDAFRQHAETCLSCSLEQVSHGWGDNS